MSKSEEIYYSYKNKDSVYYLTKNEENNLLFAKNRFIKSLSEEQIQDFISLEKIFEAYKESLIKEIINYSINYFD